MNLRRLILCAAVSSVFLTRLANEQVMMTCVSQMSSSTRFILTSFKIVMERFENDALEVRLVYSEDLRCH